MAQKAFQIVVPFAGESLMKILLWILFAALILWLSGNLVFWLIAHASGHKIPWSTDLSFALNVIIPGLLLPFILKAIRKQSKY